SLLDRYSDALAAYERALGDERLTIDERSRFLAERSMVNEMSGDGAAALEDANEAVRLSAAGFALQGRGGLPLRLGARAGAAAGYGAALQVAPEDWTSRDEVTQRLEAIERRPRERGP